MTRRLAELADDYLAEKRHGAGFRAVKSTLGMFLASAGDRPVKTLRQAHVERWLAGMEGVSDVTISTRLKHVRTFCHWLHAESHTPTDCAAAVRGPRVAKPKLRRPTPPPPEIDTDLLAAFRLDQQRRRLSPKTIEARERILRAFFVFLLPRGPRDASLADMQTWLDTCALSPHSLHTYTSTLRMLGDYFERTGQRVENPARRLPLPRLHAAVPRPIPDDDLRIALKGAEPRMRAWLCLAAYQGLRCSEIAGLRRQDLLLDREPALLIVSSPKGGNERMMPLNPITVRALRVFGLGESGYLFSLRYGRRINGATISSYVGRYMRSLGFPCSAHQLRHWFGSTVYQSTLDLRLTQSLLGHRNPSTTAIYAAFAPAKAAEVVRGLDVEARPVEAVGG